MKAPVDQPAFNIAVFALLLSLPWGFGPMWLYAGASGMSHLQGIQMCMTATLSSCSSPSQTAGFVLSGLAVTIVIESIATRADGVLSWRHATPRLGYAGCSVASLLMWLVVPLRILWFVRRQIGPAIVTADRRARND